MQERVLKAEKLSGQGHWTVHPLFEVVDDMGKTPERQGFNSSDRGKAPELDTAEDGGTIEVEVPPIANTEANSEYILIG